MFNKVNKILEMIQNIQECLKMQNEMNIMVRKCIEDLQTRIEKLERDNES